MRRCVPGVRYRRCNGTVIRVRLQGSIVYGTALRRRIVEHAIHLVTASGPDLQNTDWRGVVCPPETLQQGIYEALVQNI